METPTRLVTDGTITFCALQDAAQQDASNCAVTKIEKNTTTGDNKMGWHINLISNTVTLNKETEDAINELEHLGALAEDGALYFDDDHMEHMDYLCNEEVLQVLERGRVNGQVLFNSTEGDNNGQHWGYRFIDGQMNRLNYIPGEWVPGI